MRRYDLPTRRQPLCSAPHPGFSDVSAMIRIYSWSMIVNGQIQQNHHCPVLWQARMTFEASLIHPDLLLEVDAFAAVPADQT